MEENDFSYNLRVVSHSARDTSPSFEPSQDAAVLQAIKRLHKLCKENHDLVGTINTPLSKLFQRWSTSVSQYRSSIGLLLLVALQFFLDFGDYVLHDADPSLRIFFKSYLSRQYADPVVASATLDFLNQNKAKLLLSHSTLLPQYFPLLLKMISWHGHLSAEAFLELFPALMGPSSFLPLFPALLDLPTLVLALEDLEQRSGSLLNNNSSTFQQNPAAEALLALMDEAYTGSSTTDGEGTLGDGDSASKDVTDALFADLLKDENDGLAERHWSFPGMASALQVVMGSKKSERLKHALKFAPLLLQAYFGVAIRDVNDSLLCALLPIIFSRIDAMFPDKDFAVECRQRSLEFMLATFQQSPHFIPVLKKPIMDKIAQPFTNPAKTELALQLCWAVGEHGVGGASFKDVARELFESLELLLYESLASSRVLQTSTKGGGLKIGMASQARLLCFVVTAIAKLATCHRELGPRARVCLAKVARSQQVLDKIVWRRAQDYLGLMREPAICSAILGSAVGYQRRPGNIQWSDGNTKAVAHIPFYLLAQREGFPFHDFTLADLLGQT